MSPRKREIIHVDAEPGARDYVMARLAAARISAMAAVGAIDEAIELFVEVEEDDDGSERTELVETALENIGCATRALESAEEKMPKVDPEECEPWDADEEPAELPRATARSRRS